MRGVGILFSNGNFGEGCADYTTNRALDLVSVSFHSGIQLGIIHAATTHTWSCRSFLKISPPMPVMMFFHHLSPLSPPLLPSCAVCSFFFLVTNFSRISVPIAPNTTSGRLYVC
jgi:hypothetical protein